MQLKNLSEKTWEMFRDVFEETSLNNLSKSALFEMYLRRAVSDV